MEPLMYTPLENVFQATMQREGKNFIALNGNRTFQAFMRRCDDGQSTEDRITLYYSVDAPVSQGSLVAYGRKVYIIMNKETEENTCYYKSYGIACNGILNTNNGTISGINVYGYDMKKGNAEAQMYTWQLNGNMEFITEATYAAEEGIKINDTFNLYGRTWKIDNLYEKDGIFHITTRVVANEEIKANRRVVVAGINPDIPYRIGSCIKLVATLFDNEVEISSGDVTWLSTNPTVATIDRYTGEVHFLVEGTVFFIANWNGVSGKSNKCTVGKPVQKEYMISWGNMTGEMSIGRKRTLVMSLKETGSDALIENVKWDISFSEMDYPIKVNRLSENKFLLLIEENSAMGTTFTLTATAVDYGVAASKDIKVMRI